MKRTLTLGEVINLFDDEDMIRLYDVDQNGICVYHNLIKDLYSIYFKAKVLQFKPHDGEIEVAICW